MCGRKEDPIMRRGQESSNKISSSYRLCAIWLTFVRYNVYAFNVNVLHLEGRIFTENTIKFLCRP